MAWWSTTPVAVAVVALPTEIEVANAGPHHCWPVRPETSRHEVTLGQYRSIGR
jgi:hypothetical protein